LPLAVGGVPWQRSVMGELRHLPSTASADDVVGVLRSDGGVVVDDLAPAGVLDRVEGATTSHVHRPQAVLRFGAG